MSSQHPKYDRYGWPVDPVTGEAYRREEFIKNPALIDLFPAGHPAVRWLQAELAPKQANAAVRSRRNRSRRPGKTSRKFRADKVLSFPFETGMRATARRMAELRAQEPAIPFDGVAPEREADYEGSALDRYAIQVGW